MYLLHFILQEGERYGIGSLSVARYNIDSDLEHFKGINVIFLI
jgi:hypothetical protein